MEDSSFLYFLTEAKFRNEMIPDLPRIIFIFLIDKKKVLRKLLNINFDLNEYIDFLLNQSVISSKYEVIKNLEIYLKERGESIDFRSVE